jgi:hypothetical protein
MTTLAGMTTKGPSHTVADPFKSQWSLTLGNG